MLLRNKRIILNSIGIFYVLFGIVAIVNAIYLRHRQGSILWFCYIGVILIGIGALRKDDLLITSQLSILTIPFIVWIIDFFYILINGSTLFGISDYFFVPGPLISKIVTTQHLFTIPVGIFLLYLIKIKNNKAWLVGFIEVSILFFVTKLFTLEGKNTNCVFRNCIEYPLPYYSLLWFAGFFIMIFLVNYILINIPFLKEK